MALNSLRPAVLLKKEFPLLSSSCLYPIHSLFSLCLKPTRLRVFLFLPFSPVCLAFPLSLRMPRSTLTSGCPTCKLRSPYSDIFRWGRSWLTDRGGEKKKSLEFSCFSPHYTHTNTLMRVGWRKRENCGERKPGTVFLKASLALPAPPSGRNDSGRKKMTLLPVPYSFVSSCLNCLQGSIHCRSVPILFNLFFFLLPSFFLPVASWTQRAMSSEWLTYESPSCCLRSRGGKWESLFATRIIIWDFVFLFYLYVNSYPAPLV